MIKISVIISVYNCEEYLEECLQSLEKQTMPKNEFEAIIINDGSKDNSLSIIKKYVKINKNYVLIDRENKGLAISRNEGMDICKGEYITFFDADDTLEPNALETMYNELTQSKAEIGIFRTKIFTSKSKSQDRYTSKFDKMNKITSLKEDITLATMVRSVAILYHRQIIEKLRFIPSVVHEDNYFCDCAYNKAKKIYLSESVVYNIRQREGENLSITQKLNFKTYQDLLKNISTADHEIKYNKLISIHANQLYSYIIKYVKSEDKKKAFNLLYKYLKEMKNANIISLVEYLKIYNKIKIKILLKR